jgi:oligopeptide transport system ATP-binding protein
MGSTDLLTLRSGPLNDLRGGSVAMVYQDPLSALNPVMTVGRQITEAIERHRHVSHREAERRAAELLDIVGIPGAKRRLREYPHQFSGGMRQRVMIAMAISCDPSLLIADEPTTALDVTVQAQILDLLAGLKRSLGMALIVITHDLGIVAGITDRVLIMYAGQIVEDGPTELVLDEPQMPYTLGLLRSVPRLDLPRQAALTPIPGAPPDPTVVEAGCPFVPRCTFRIDRCVSHNPALEEIEAGHRIACWVDVTTGAPRRTDAGVR